MANENRGEPEARLLWASGKETLLACYHVGIYSDKQLIGQGNFQKILLLKIFNPSFCGTYSRAASYVERSLLAQARYYDTFQKWFQKKSLKFLPRYPVPWFYDVHHQAVNLFILCTSMAFHLKFYGRIKGKTLAINLKNVEEKNVIRFFAKTPFY